MSIIQRENFDIFAATVATQPYVTPLTFSFNNEIELPDNIIFSVTELASSPEIAKYYTGTLICNNDVCDLDIGSVTEL